MVFLQTELRDIRVDIPGDNEDPKAITDNPSSASKSKHIDVKLHLSRGSVRTGGVRVLCIGTKEQHADVLAKALRREKSLVHHVALINLS